MSTTMHKSYSRSFINSVPDKENNVNSTNINLSTGLNNKFKRQISSKEVVSSSSSVMNTLPSQPTNISTSTTCSNDLYSSLAQLGVGTSKVQNNDSSKVKCNTLPDCSSISSALYTNRSGDYSRELLRKFSSNNSCSGGGNTSNLVEKKPANSKISDRELVNTSATYYFSEKTSILNGNSVKNTSSSINLSTSSSSSSCSSQNKNQLRENLSIKNSKKVEKYLADISEKGSKKTEGGNNSTGTAAAAVNPCIKKEKPKDIAHPQQLLNKIQLTQSASKPREGLSYKELESEKITQMYSKEIIETLKQKDVNK